MARILYIRHDGGIATVEEEILIQETCKILTGAFVGICNAVRE